MVIASYLLDKARKKGYKQGYAEGYAEGFAKGYAKGRAEAYADANKQSKAYFRRMREAMEAGEDFNEPRPKFGRNGR